MTLRVVRAGAERAWELTGVIARAMVDDPLVRWPLRPGADAEIVRKTWFGVVEVFAREGALWETEGGGGVAAWLGPDQVDAYPEIERASREDVRPYTDDGGARYATQWDWVEEHLPTESCWFLEVIGVDPSHQGLGLGTALVDHGLGVAREQGLPAFLETANPRNVPYYERFGFRVVADGDAPGGGPRFWFMRLDPPAAPVQPTPIPPRRPSAPLLVTMYVLKNVTGATVVGVRGHLVAVEAHVGRGLPLLTITGLTGAGKADPQTAKCQTFSGENVAMQLAPIVALEFLGG